MKRIYLFATAAAMSLLLFAGCSDSADAVRPQLEAADTQIAVQGKWRIERISSKLCKSGNCNTRVYVGAPEDYFELRADSAFLLRSATTYTDRFKAEYTFAGGFVLRNFGWSARYEVRHKEANRLVLESTFTGTDPNAVFTDTYYLYQ